MAALGDSTTWKTRPRGGTTLKSYIVTNAAQLYGGGLVGLRSTGFAHTWDDVLTSRACGLAIEPVLGDTSSSSTGEHARVKVRHGVVVRGLTLAGTPTQAKVGDLVYCASDNLADATLTAGNVAIGWMSAYNSATDQELTLFTPEELEAKI